MRIKFLRLHSIRYLCFKFLLQRAEFFRKLRHIRLGAYLIRLLLDSVDVLLHKRIELRIGIRYEFLGCCLSALRLVALRLNCGKFLCFLPGCESKVIV